MKINYLKRIKYIKKNKFKYRKKYQKKFRINYIIKFIFSFALIILYTILFRFNSNSISEPIIQNIPFNNSTINNTGLKVCLCMIGKLENLYVEESVEYYLKLGYDHIFIYDNNDNDAEHIEDVVKKYISKNLVTIIDYRGREKKEKQNLQIEAYYDCYDKNSNNYDWLSFYDFDEYLYLKNHTNIKDFLSEEKLAHCENIKINWVMYTDNNLVYYDKRPILERFTEPLFRDIQNRAIKSTVRGHKKINYWTNATNPHTSPMNFTACTPTGKIMPDNKSAGYRPPNHEIAYIKHFRTKTIEEFINKTKRGKPYLVSQFDEKFWRRIVREFFKMNKRTKEKIDYINKVLNMSFH